MDLEGLRFLILVIIVFNVIKLKYKQSMIAKTSLIFNILGCDSYIFTAFLIGYNVISANNKCRVDPYIKCFSRIRKDVVKSCSK